MKTTHRIIFEDAREMKHLENESVELMITSPPYPMIEMWDGMFSNHNPKVKEALNDGNGAIAFEEMHKELDKVWREAYRVLKKGGWACINIGDATRTIGNSFKLYPNHVRIISYCMELGFSVLPEIIWRKLSNKPNKFMGSGTLPAGAYISQEHEYILILRKGEKREFKTDEEKAIRQNSAFFWEERNKWFSDIWEDIKGDKQTLTDEKIRKRSAAFPFELAYRLICMFSVQGDTVLDPYFGTGTAMMGAMALGRNSIGIEIDQHFENTIYDKVEGIIDLANEYTERRKTAHLTFVKNRVREKGELKHKHHNFPVMSRQEINLNLPKLQSLRRIEGNAFEVAYI